MAGSRRTDDGYGGDRAQRRGSGKPVRGVKSISESLDPKLFPEIRSIKALYSESVVQIERIAGAVTLLGLVAIGLAGVGVLGLVSFSVRERTKEIAIRLALGATSSDILKAILRQFAAPA